MATKHHNQGQSDGAQGKYKPPHSLLDTLLTDIFGSNRESRIYDQQNKDYDKGYKNSKKNR